MSFLKTFLYWTHLVTARHSTTICWKAEVIHAQIYDVYDTICALAFRECTVPYTTCTTILEGPLLDALPAAVSDGSLILKDPLQAWGWLG